ncbi:hypothetical protein EDD11_006513 [Mortierella claussenii]|nr:hypothetical protein EDD11_006513 [Mortierella claussenii]
MINGVASVDLEIKRIQVSEDLEQREQGQWMLREQRQLSSVAGTYTPMDQQQQQPVVSPTMHQRFRIYGEEIWQALENQQQAWQKVENQSQPQQQEPLHQTLQQRKETHAQQRVEGGSRVAPDLPLPLQIHYKTIALHTPGRLTPIISMFLDDTARGDIPIRVELDADVIRYKGRYQIEIVLSEEVPSYQTPSPSSCYRMLDSMFHNVAATCIPNPATADIWFEFYSKTCPHSHSEECAASDKQSLEVVGAHEDVLSRHQYFAVWIKCERQRQAERRREELREEWRIHLEAQAELERALQPREYEMELGNVEAMEQDQILEHPPSFTFPLPLSAHHPQQYEEQHFQAQHQPFEHAYDYQHGRHSPSYPYHIQKQRLEQPQNQQHSPQRSPSLAFQSYPDFKTGPKVGYFFDGPANEVVVQTASPGYMPQDECLFAPQSASTLPHHQPTMQSYQPMQRPLPALRIPVRNMSVGTFQVLLQYLYTGQIGITEQQRMDIEVYWNESPEDRQLPSEENNDTTADNSDQQGPTAVARMATFEPGHGRQATDTQDRVHRSAASIILPPLGCSPREQQNQGQRQDQDPLTAATAGTLFLPRGSRDGDLSGSDNRGTEPQRPRQTFTAPLYAGWNRSFSSASAMIASSPVYSIKSASALSSWLPCSRRSCIREDREDQLSRQAVFRGQERQVPSIGVAPQRQHPGPHPDPSLGSVPSQGQAYRQGQDQHGGHGFPQLIQLPSSQPQANCSWEDLLIASAFYNLQDLRELAMKAIQYHCQIMTLRGTINMNVLAEAAHNGFDETRLDLQLALGEQVLRAFLSLYRSPLLKENDERMAIIPGPAPAPGHEDDDDVGGVEGQASDTDDDNGAAIDLVIHHGERWLDPIPERIRRGMQQKLQHLQQRQQLHGEIQRDQQHQEQQMRQHQQQQGSESDLTERLFEGPECDDALLELCAELQSHYLTMRNIMQGHQE